MTENKNRWTVKDKLEIAEAICTIVVSIMALWGTISAFNHHIFTKAARLIDHYHREIVVKEGHPLPDDGKIQKSS